MDIQVGDRVTYIDELQENNFITRIITDSKLCEDIKNWKIKILKIERLKYEEIEKKKELLTEKEKRYLRDVIRPFRDKITYIVKEKNYDSTEYIGIYLKSNCGYLPDFEENTMYKGMKIDKEYTLEELGL